MIPRTSLLAGLLLSLLAGSRPGPAREVRGPNVVLLVADDLGYGDLGCYGSKSIRTPRLDRLAGEGRRFLHYHAAQPVCSASRAALLTGCYSNRIGIHGALGPQAVHGISGGEATLAQVLKEKSYATAAFGKWHLGHHPQFLPTRHGFDEYLGLPYSNDMWPRHPEAKPGAFPPLPLIDGDRVIDPEVTAEDQAQLTERYTGRAVQFIEREKARPFFLYVAYSMPHVPLFASESFRGKSPVGPYGDVVEEIDASAGRILDALARAGVEDNTLVIFTSDNGPWLSYGSHAGSAGMLREGKGTVWEGGIRVPCILRWPGKIPAGTSDAFWNAIDILPTVARLAGAKLPQWAIDGLDVWPWISGMPGASNPHEAYFHYFAENELQALTSGDGRWKLVLPHKHRTLGGKPGGTDGIPVKYEERRVEKPELYDLERDRGETTDVSASQLEIVRRLEALAEKAREELGDSLTNRAGQGARNPGRLAVVRRDFSSDPGWEGFRNRLLPDPPPRTRQDFGHSPTRHAGGKNAGEAGGRVHRSVTPAWYAKKIPDVSLEDRLEASGRFSVTRDDGGSGALLGWFHESSRGWRASSSLVIRIDGNGGGYRVFFEYGTKNWLTGGGATFEGRWQTTKTKPHLPDGTPHDWKLLYDPASNGGDGEITLLFDSVEYRAPVLPGHKADGAIFNRFGILNMQVSGASLDLWLDDVSLGGQLETFDGDPGWEARGTHTEFEERVLRPFQDFGRAATSFAGGTPGELGGTLWRDETPAYCAERVGPLGLGQELVASGKLAFTGAGSDSGAYVGWFNAEDMRRGTREQIEPLRNMLAVFIEGPSVIGHYFRPAFATSSGVFSAAEDGPVIRPDGQPHDWSLRFKPPAAGARGRLVAELDGKQRALEIDPDQFAKNARLDRFGIFTARPGGHYVAIYLDDVSFTAAAE